MCHAGQILLQNIEKPEKEEVAPGDSDCGALLVMRKGGFMGNGSDRLGSSVLCCLLIVLLSGSAAAHGWMAPEKFQEMQNPVPAGSASVEQGRVLFKDFCAGCHGGEGKGLPAAATGLQADTPDLKTRLASHSDGDFFWKIRNGRGLMPSFEEVLEDDEVWQIIHFIRSGQN